MPNVYQRNTFSVLYLCLWFVYSFVWFYVLHVKDKILITFVMSLNCHFLFTFMRVQL